jgi:cell shape-determining protein MreD
LQLPDFIGSYFLTFSLFLFTLEKTQEKRASFSPPLALVFIVIWLLIMISTGKSFLLNCLLGRQDGFAIGPTVNPCTKGKSTTPPFLFKVQKA